MPALPKPTTDAELQERLHELESALAADRWEGVTRTPEAQALLRRYALGEIGESEFRALTAKSRV